MTGTPAVGNGVSASFQGLRASTAALQVRSYLRYSEIDLCTCRAMAVSTQYSFVRSATSLGHVKSLRHYPHGPVDSQWQRNQ